MKLGPPSSNINNILINSLPIIPRLPQSALQWSTAASAAAAISYADRGTSAIAASSLLHELHWSESKLGEVQSAFWLGYALTQVLGGVLGGQQEQEQQEQGAAKVVVGDDDIIGKDGDFDETESNNASVKTGGYRMVLPISLFFTGLTTLLFPLAATMGGPSWASADRFCLGLLEGVMLPASMAGVSATTSTPFDNKGRKEGTECDNTTNNNNNNKATASAIVIAGCYLGSAWAYLSAWFLFSERFQLQIAGWGYQGSIWPWVFYVNGILSMGCLVLFRDEFNFFGSLGSSWFNSNAEQSAISASPKRDTTADATTDLSTESDDIWKDTVSIAKSTLSSKSGRAIIWAQIGQGALLSSIASWGPLYLERLNTMPSDAMQQTASSITDSAATISATSSVSAVAVTASIAASSLILPQISQALVGVSIGASADQLSSKIGTKTTRRVLQIISGVVPAIILWYLSQLGSGNGSGSGDDVAELLSPTFLFGTAQTISALSLGAVSVSQLDIATPNKAGAVYALGCVASAAAGSFTVYLFGRLLDNGASGMDPVDASSAMSLAGGGGGGANNEFALPFQVVAILSAVGSLVYGFTVETELEIGIINGTDDANSTAIIL